MKHSETEEVSTEELLLRAFHDFLDTKMNIPGSTISRMVISNIRHKEEIDFDMILVEFSTMSPVNTIFKYVRNLAPGQKVSIFIPPVLLSRHDDLVNLAYPLRNGPVRHKTVVKYLGNSLALYARKDNARNWQLVSDQPIVSSLSVTAVPPIKRPRAENSDNEIETDDAKKPRKSSSDDELEPPKNATPAVVVPSPENSTPPSSIPKPILNTVPNYFKPKSLLQTQLGGFWPANDPRSPDPKTKNC